MSAFDEAVAEAQACHAAGQLSAAAEAYRQALRHAPGHKVVLHNLGVLALAQRAYHSALEHFEAVVTAEPNYASAHFHRAVALQQLGRLSEAMRSLYATCALEPGHYEAHRTLGFALLDQNQRDRALDHFARTYELRRGEDRGGLARTSLTCATRAKLGHDIAQFRHLAGRLRGGDRFELLARAYERVAADFPTQSTPLNAAQLDALGEDYNTAIHILSAPEQACGVVREPINGEQVRAQFDAQHGLAWIDDVLSAPALARLQRVLLESTIWHDFDHIGSFVAAYLEDGLANPLLLQLVCELRARLPHLLGDQPLTQAWAFKGLRPTAAIDAHADDAAISVNLWLTPDVANLEPGRGGLVVCRAPPPADWQIKGYHADSAAISAFLARHRDDCVVVPYRANRAVIFVSGLFHHSDAPNFADGYENARINLTLLFGQPAR